jgi:RNA polymerase sigma-70 factor (ECF subfamily)
MSSPRRRDSLAHLSDRLRRGDLAASEELFRAMHAPLCEVADSYVQSQAIAEEIVQDLFFAIWMKRDRLPNVDSLQAYFFTAARNRSLHHLRHRAMVRRWTSWAGAESDVAGVAASPPPADEALEADERRARIRGAIDRLPPRARLALVLQRDHEMTHTEIAEAMDITLKGVEKLLATARQKLRPLLEAEREGAR